MSGSNDNAQARDGSDPDPREVLGKIRFAAWTNAIHAALGYERHMKSPTHQPDVFAHITRTVDARFWDDIYVKRPEVERVSDQLETGQLVLVVGEPGTGKSTVLLAARHYAANRTHANESANTVWHIFDASKFEADLAVNVTATIHREMYNALTQHAIDDYIAWLSYLYSQAPEFEALRLSVRQAGIEPDLAADWENLASAPQHKAAYEAGREAFTSAPHSAQLRTLLAFIGSRARYEPVLIVDNVDQLQDEIIEEAATALSVILHSSDYRVRGAIAVRPDNVPIITAALDTVFGPRTLTLGDKGVLYEPVDAPSLDFTMKFLSRRLSVLQEPDTLAQLRAATREEFEKAFPNAGASDEAMHDAFFDELEETLSFLVYDFFAATRISGPRASGDSSDFFADAILRWHNGSLREMGLSLALFASHILENRTDMYQLRTLIDSVVATRNQPISQRRWLLLRLTRSLLYRHLLFWGTDDASRPTRAVLVLDGSQELTKPPFYFLRLRILQHVAHRPGRKTTVKAIQRSLGLLGIAADRTEEAIRDLATKRSVEGTGLVRVNVPPGTDVSNYPPETTVTLLDAGEFLVRRLCFTSEYLFWSALNVEAAARSIGLQREPTPREIQSDAFRARIAARFLEHYLTERLRDEHPYLEGPTNIWPRTRAQERLMLYERLFGFARGDWFLTRCHGAISAFIATGDRREDFGPAKESLKRMSKFMTALDDLRRE